MNTNLKGNESSSSFLLIFDVLYVINIYLTNKFKKIIKNVDRVIV